MITLYRASSDAPQIATEALRRELVGLEKERDGGPAGEYMVDAFQRMGKEKYVRLVELRGVVREQQFFSDSEAQVRAHAGIHKYLSVLMVPDEDAKLHIVSVEEMGAVGEKAIPHSKNYAFTGDELIQHAGSWRMVVNQLGA